MKTFIIALCIFIAGVCYFNSLAKEQAIRDAQAQTAEAKRKEFDDWVGRQLFPQTKNYDEVLKDTNWCKEQGMDFEILGGGNAGAQHVICIPFKQSRNENRRLI